MIKQFLISTFCIILLASCAFRFPPRYKEDDGVKKKPVNHITKLKKCVNDFMTEHGVGIEEAFDTCSKIYRR